MNLEIIKNIIPKQYEEFVIHAQWSNDKVIFRLFHFGVFSFGICFENQIKCDCSIPYNTDIDNIMFLTWNMRSIYSKQLAVIRKISEVYHEYRNRKKIYL